MQRTVRSHHSSPAFARGEQRHSRYRGYDIKMERRDLCWMVTMKPCASDLPEFRRYSFQTATQSELVRPLSLEA
jgi:hypothetical protein